MNSKKERRKERKKRKLLAEYELARSNDEEKRPGQLLDSDVAKKFKLDVSEVSVSVTNGGEGPEAKAEEPESKPPTDIKPEATLVIPIAEMKILRRQLEERKERILAFEMAKTKFVFKRYPVELEQEQPNNKKPESDPPMKYSGQVATSNDKPPRLSPEEFKLMKKQLQERKKILKQLPRFQLQAAGLSASLTTSNIDRVPILMCDIQHLLLYALCGNDIMKQPQRWCLLEKYNHLTHIVVLVIEGLTVNDFLINEHLFPKLTDQFYNRVEVLSPLHYGSEVSQELASVPLSVTQKDNLIRKFGTLEAAVSSKEVFKVFRSIFPIQLPKSNNGGDSDRPILKAGEIPKLPPGDMFSRVYLLLSLNQMLSENYPLPIENQVSNKYTGFKLTKADYREVSENSPLFAIDCEMCMTNVRSELTHIAVVDEQLKVVYESFVKPKNPIVNYLTRFSGITKEILEDVTTTLEDVQQALQKLLPEDAILVGHSLNCDLEAMEMIHPYIIDTSVVFNMTGYRGRKSKLANLSEYHLEETIQQSKEGHSPTEDATAAMKLVKLKLSKGYNFGDFSLSQEKSDTIPECQLTSSIFSHTRKASKTVCMVGSESTLEVYKNYSTGENNSARFVRVPEDEPKSTISALKDSAVNHNFALAHLNLSKKLEKIKKSRNSSRKQEKLFHKVDKWCDEVYNHVSLNGLCVVLFSGPTTTKTILEQKYPTDDPDSFNSTSNALHNENGNSDDGKSSFESSQFEIKAKLETNPRQNGVCFIRINSPKQ